LGGEFAGEAESGGDFAGLVEKLAPYLTWLERRLKPRFTFLYNRWLDGVTGLVCLALAIIVFLPIPGANMLPALAIAAFGLGIAERDGLLGLFGGVVTAISFSVMALLSGAIIAAAVTFVRVLVATIDKTWPF
jgi:hypothetical protein